MEVNQSQKRESAIKIIRVLAIIWSLILMAWSIYGVVLVTVMGHGAITIILNAIFGFVVIPALGYLSSVNIAKYFWDNVEFLRSIIPLVIATAIPTVAIQILAMIIISIF